MRMLMAYSFMRGFRGLIVLCLAGLLGLAAASPASGAVIVLDKAEAAFVDVPSQLPERWVPVTLPHDWDTAPA